MWAILWARIPVWLKVGAGVLAAVFMAQLGKWTGAKDTRIAPQVQAIKEASSRNSNTEENNADFRGKSARDRCLVLRRESELPDSGCD